MNPKEPFKNADAAAAKFAREMGMRRRAGFNPYGFELWSFCESPEPAGLQQPMGFYKEAA